MRLPKEAIVANINCYNLTLQLPINASEIKWEAFDHIGDNLQVEDMPDQWFCWLREYHKGKFGPCIKPNRNSWLFLSPAGIEANKELIKAKFDAEAARIKALGMTPKFSFDDFVAYAKAFYAGVIAETNHQIQKHEREIAVFHETLPAYNF